ncbi:MAG: hypothetical protein IAI50_18330 [Candidatus Eremiobacteraeota bacterium]|nr:hypothetical protein [Candidatus Eremiobacteraeota bacterium]
MNDLWKRCFIAAALSLALGAAPSRALSTSTQIVYASVEHGIASFDSLTGKKLGFLQTNFGPFGVALDANGDVFAGGGNADPASYRVKEYAPDSDKPIRNIRTEESDAYFAVSAAGELAVAGHDGPACCGNSLEFFEAGQTQPSRLIREKPFTTNYLAYDASGRCWVDGKSQGRAAFGYVAPGASHVTVVALTGTAMGPMTVDAQGNVVIVESGILRAYTPAGKPAYEVHLLGRPATITGIALSSDNTRLYVSNLYEQSEAFHYPSGGRPALYFGTYAGGIAVGN